MAEKSEAQEKGGMTIFIITVNAVGAYAIAGLCNDGNSTLANLLLGFIATGAVSVNSALMSALILRHWSKQS